MMPAARVTDFHTCPLQTPAVVPVPHVGGPIIVPSAPTVLIGGLPAAGIGSMCTCVGPPDSVVKGSPTVLIGGRPAARLGDLTAHGGSIVVGCFNVLIGDAPGVSPPVDPGALADMADQAAAAAAEGTAAAADAAAGVSDAIADQQAHLQKLIDSGASQEEINSAQSDLEGLQSI